MHKLLNAIATTLAHQGAYCRPWQHLLNASIISSSYLEPLPDRRPHPPFGMNIELETVGVPWPLKNQAPPNLDMPFEDTIIV